MGRNRERNLLVVGLVGLLAGVICIGALVVWAAHGVSGLMDMSVYGHLLESLPTPPGLLPQSDRVDLTPYHLWAQRDYQVDVDHGEVVDFFRTSLAQQGWSLRQESNERIDVDTGPTGYLEWTRLLFTFREYWLYIDVSTWVDAEGRRVDDNTLVMLAVSKDEEAIFRLSGFLR